MAEDTAFHIAERIRQAVEKIDAWFGDDCIRFTASFGVSSMVPTLNNPPDQRVNLADQALYLAKHNGRNRVEILQAVDTGSSTAFCHQNAGAPIVRPSPG